MIFNKQAFNFKNQLKALSNLQTMVICAFFIALYIVLYNFNIKISSDIQFRPGFIALAAAAMYGGPIIACVVGGLGDILSMIATGGQGEAFFFGLTFNYALMGFLFGVILYGEKITVIRCIAAALVEFVISLVLTTYWLNIMYYGNKNYFSLMLTRTPKCIITLVISSVILSIVLKSLYEAFRKARLLPNYQR